MRGSFLGLDIAVRGLYTSQRALHVTSHNISNVNTPGYSRQIGAQRATNAIGLFDGTGMVGTGVEITSVNRIRDDFLDYKFWSENVSLGEWETKMATMEHLEAVFDEISGNGFNRVMDEFFTGLQEVAKDPSSLQARELLKTTGVTMSKYFNRTSSQLQKLQQDQNYAFRLKVDETNSYAKQIRDISEQIYKSELDGNKANDLRDERTVLVDKLSKLVNVEAHEVVVGTLPGGRENRQFQVILNGSFLVNHTHAHEIECYEDQNNMYQLRWKDSGNTLEPRGGELKAYKDVRDGNALQGTYKGIPYYMQKLDEFARDFAKAFNEGIFKDGQKYYPGHASGIGMDGSIGVRFFTYNHISSDALMAAGSNMDDRYAAITAANITISSDIQRDIDKIAAASAGDQPGNNININQLLRLRHDIRMFAEGAPEDFMKALVANLGIDSQQAVRIATNQDSIVKQIENRRLSISGVSIDEEMANLVRYQHAYNAAARMIAVMNEIYDVTINRMGI